MDLEPEPKNNIRSLTMENFTTFADTTLDFKNLNIIIGENGSGKTHLLKLLYVVMAANQQQYRSVDRPAEHGRPDGLAIGDARPTKNVLEERLTAKLANVFRPEERVGRLVRRKRGQDRCRIGVEAGSGNTPLRFNFAASNSKVAVTDHPPVWYDDAPVFLPTHELLAVYPGFSWLYENYAIQFDETWYDTVKLLAAPPLRGRRKADASALSKPLENVLGGTVVFDGSKFYLRHQDGKMEMPLVAEGLRKVGMLAQLINTGQLSDTGCLFWDEPESNLNPKIIRQVAEAIFHIAQSGIQAFIATHSVFLLKELAILGRGNEAPQQRYYALEKGEDGVAVHQADDIHSINPFTMLDEESEQSYRLTEAFGK